MVIIQVLGYTISGPNYTVQASLIFILLVLTLGKAKGDWCCLGRNNERSSRNRSYSIPSGHGIIFESCVARSATSRRGHDVQILRLCCPDSHFFGLFYYARARKYLGQQKGTWFGWTFWCFTIPADNSDLTYYFQQSHVLIVITISSNRTEIYKDYKLRRKASSGANRVIIWYIYHCQVTFGIWLLSSRH